QRVARDVREQHTAAFEHVPIFDGARDATATFRACPLIAAKRAAINRLEALDDSRLQRKEIRTCSGKIHRVRQSTARSGVARQRAKTDVRSKLHAVEMNGRNGAVR